MSTPTYYAIIPAEIRYDKNLKTNEKLLYGEITCLTNKSGQCYAKNSYFAKLYGVSKETISRWISKLRVLGYIETKVEYKQGTKEILNRYITLLTKRSIGIDEKIKDNNTSNNNTRITYGQKDLSAVFSSFSVSNKDELLELFEYKKNIDRIYYLYNLMNDIILEEGEIEGFEINVKNINRMDIIDKEGQLDEFYNDEWYYDFEYLFGLNKEYK